MALQTRHLYVARRVDEALGIRNLAVTEELLKERDVLDELNYFFSAKGPPRILIYFLTPEEARAKGCCVSKPVKQMDIPAALMKAVLDRRNSHVNNMEGDIDISASNAGEFTASYHRCIWLTGCHSKPFYISHLIYLRKGRWGELGSDTLMSLMRAP
jgi:hypothetical protein